MAALYDILRDNWLLLLIGQYPYGPLGGIAATLILSVLGIALAFPLSVALALARLSPWIALRWPVTALVYAVRGIPLLMIILWTYFLLPILLGHVVSGFATMLCTLVLYEACYLSEVVRAGIEALPKGQGEAARSLGHGYVGRMRFVILPQALFNMLPSMLSQFISTIQDTTLGYVINVQELTFAHIHRQERVPEILLTRLRSHHIARQNSEVHAAQRTSGNLAKRGNKPACRR
ncbi:MAG: amino acid ABC transporter permease [Verrucomicrobiaceae bacterium]|nr:MAG: amino acid ABC transporter permease [Verrucomicrobiaceae bacterium]